MVDFALLLIGFIFAGWALICFDPKTRLPNEGGVDWRYETEMWEVFRMSLKPDFTYAIGCDPADYSFSTFKHHSNGMIESLDAMQSIMGFNAAVNPNMDRRAYLSITDPDFAAKWMNESLGFGVKCFNAPYTEFEDGNGY